MPKKDKKDKVEEKKEEAPQEESVPEPTQGRKEKNTRNRIHQHNLRQWRS